MINWVNKESDTVTSERVELIEVIVFLFTNIKMEIIKSINVDGSAISAGYVITTLLTVEWIPYLYAHF